jgi:hypothetical protein
MDFRTGDLGTGGAKERAVELRFRGSLGEPFVAFALRRAARLSLRGWIEAEAPDHVTVAAEGPEALVDAFEIACSLGPIDAFVQDWTCEERALGINSAVFERRRNPIKDG